MDEPYSVRGLSASQLEALLTREATAVAGKAVGVAFPGRGAVLWHAGSIRFIGPIGDMFELAIDGVLDDVDLGSGTQVREALLSIAGARLVVDRPDPVR